MIFFLIQKLIINADRRIDKQEKDINAILNLLPCILNDDIHKKELFEIYNGLSKKRKKKVDHICKKYKIDDFIEDLLININEEDLEL